MICKNCGKEKDIQDFYQSNLGTCRECTKSRARENYYFRFPVRRTRKERRACTIPKCKALQHARGFCDKHYHRFKKHGDPNWRFIKKTCSVPGCGKPVYGRGWCQLHWERWYKHGDPLKQLRTREVHGLRHTPEYDVWHAMNDRCSSPKSKFYHRYGGRGISVCGRWRHSFKTFIEDMGRRPFPGAQIDRINNDGNYESGNCRWVTRLVNTRNRPRPLLRDPRELLR